MYKEERNAHKEERHVHKDERNVPTGDAVGPTVGNGAGRGGDQRKLGGRVLHCRVQQRAPARRVRLVRGEGRGVSD